MKMKKKKEDFDWFLCVVIGSGSKEPAQTYATMLWTETLKRGMVTRLHCIGKVTIQVMMGS